MLNALICTPYVPPYYTGTYSLPPLLYRDSTPFFVIHLQMKNASGDILSLYGVHNLSFVCPCVVFFMKILVRRIP
jgi:hypothetical protein